MSCGLILLVNAYALSAVFVFSNRCNVFVWTGENASKTLCGREFFENGEKKIPLPPGVDRALDRVPFLY